MSKATLTTVTNITSAIRAIRGHKVLLDEDLARIYGVSTKALNQAIKRNIKRFPSDFMFQLTGDEADSLRSQIVTLKTGRGQHRKFLPYAFTEHGAIMAANVLNSPEAVRMAETKLPERPGYEAANRFLIKARREIAGRAASLKANHV